MSKQKREDVEDWTTRYDLCCEITSKKTHVNGELMNFSGDCKSPQIYAVKTCKTLEIDDKDWRNIQSL